MINIFFSPVENSITIKKETIWALSRLGIKTIRDLVFYKPASYQIKDINPNLSELQDGQLIQTKVTIEKILPRANSRVPLKVIAGNDTGSVTVVFFNKIPPFIYSRLREGTEHIISGKIQLFDYHFQISHPEFILQKSLESAYEPIYPLTYGLINKQLYGYIIHAMDFIEKQWVLQAKNLQPEISQYVNELIEDLKILHLYKSNIATKDIKPMWEKVIKKLATAELFANQASLLKVRRQKHIKNGRIFVKASGLQENILAKLGFTLTPSQLEVIKEIEAEQKLSVQMMRLLQGDVGSGKTLVALLTMLNVAATGSQCCLMAPTDLLANQHYQFFANVLEGSGIKCELLTGKTSAKNRAMLTQELEKGETLILIGTHALFQEKVNFKDLAYVVIDEQHRFGVEQRLALINKASHPDVLIMTATPIPRSLTLTMFGDMAVSKLIGKPKDRLPITTTVNPLSKLPDIIHAVNKKLVKGEGVYWVCPLISEEEMQKNKNLQGVYPRFLELQNIYPGTVEMLHGKMNNIQRDSTMQRFKSGEIRILVATTIIEVGIDVPEATLIVIENAEHFGLAQLHQLRGRVGRGSLQSHCIMLYNPTGLSATARERLNIMHGSNDGFYIAEKDLMLRGSGEIIGTKQSGEPEFFFADLARDMEILITAHKSAETLEFSEFINWQIELFARKDHEVIKSG